MLYKDDHKLGYAECEKDEARVGLKEIVECRLHAPKTMRDMLVRATRRVNSELSIVRRLGVVDMHQTRKKMYFFLCYAMSSQYFLIDLRMHISVMDLPNEYISRLLRLKAYAIPLNPALMVKQHFPILKLPLKAKASIAKPPKSNVLMSAFVIMLDYSP